MGSSRLFVLQTNFTSTSFRSFRCFSTEAPDYQDLPPKIPLDFPFDRKIRSVLLVKKWQSIAARDYAQKAAAWLTERGIQVFLEPTTIGDYEQEYPSILDLVHHTDTKSSRHVAACFPALACMSHYVVLLHHMFTSDRILSYNFLSSPQQLISVLTPPSPKS
jgi:hypothetical protein